MRHGHADLTELREELRAGCEGVAEALLGPPSRAKSTKHTLHFAGAITLEVQGPKRGVWYDHLGKHGNNMLGLIRHVRGGSFPDAVAWARSWTGLGEPTENVLDDEQERQRQAQRDADREARQAAQEAAAAADRAARIRGARRYAVAPASVPVSDPRGDLGAWYLNRVRGSPTPAGGHPDCVRFHPGKNALLVVATTEDGAAQAVQFIHLDDLGEKLDREDVEARDLPGVKWTYGPLDAAAVRLPGDPAGPLLIAEGFETGYSAFASTGHETWIALGSVGRLDLPVGRKVVVLRDDDAEGSPADRQLRAVLAGWHRDGFDVSVATPWATRRGDTSDFNDLIRADGPAAVRGRIQAALAPLSGPPRATPTHGLPAYYPAPVEPREQALARQAGLIHEVIAQGGRGAVIRREIARLRAEAVEADPDWDERPPSHKAAITRRIKRDVLLQHGMTQVPRARRALIVGAQGSGKTHTALVETAALTGDIVVRVTEPSLAKAEEALGDYLGLMGPDSLPGVLVRGRSADDPTGEEGAKMCPRHEIATKAALKGVQVRAAICGSCSLRPTETQAGCSYLQQEARIKAKGARGVFFGSSAYNFLSCPAPPPDILIADESITLAAIDNVLTLAPDTLENPVPFKGARLADVIRANQITTRLRDALMDPQPLARLRQDGPARDELVFAQGLLEAAVEARQIAPVDGAMSDREIERILDDTEANTAGVALVVIGAVLRELNQPRDVLNGIAFDPSRPVMVDGREERLPRLRVHRLRTLRDVTKDTTVLLLDGTGSERLNRALVPDLELHRFAIERDAYVTGTRGKSYSRQSCTGEDRNGEPMPNKVEDARRLRLDIGAIAARQPGPAFIVATRRTAEKLRDEGAVPDPENIAHYGKLRGRNDWEGCPSGIAVGAESISVAAVEDLARPFMVNDPIPFVSMARKPDEGWAYQQWPYKATRGRRMRDGTVQPIEVEVHPDPRVQEVLEQVREAEVLQGIDRPRPIFNHRKFVLMNSLALDLTYDRVLTHREVVAGGGRLELVFAALGLLPLGAADLATAYPAPAFRDGFASKATAKDCLDKLAESGGVLQMIYYLGNPPTYSYRRAGQRGSASRALIDTRRHPCPRLALEALLGPLAGDPVLVASPPPEPDPPPDGPDKGSGELLAVAEACGPVCPLPASLRPASPIWSPDLEEQCTGPPRSRSSGTPAFGATRGGVGDD